METREDDPRVASGLFAKLPDVFRAVLAFADENQLLIPRNISVGGDRIVDSLFRNKPADANDKVARGKTKSA